MKTILKRLATCAALAACGIATASPPSPLMGRWITESGNLEVEIAPCGDALCGSVTRALANRAMSPGDTRPHGPGAPAPIGTRILSDLRSESGGRWQGRIFNRENATTYDCVLEPMEGGTLKVRAYKGIRLFGKTFVWRRIGGGQE
jgi:uncharacterized protein (DUF2147 family)